MTSYPDRLPTLTNDLLPIKPPFEFNGLSVRVFPLRASLDALQKLTNDYLNFIPPEAGRFRASVPYVYLAMLDYGQIAEETMPIGWFAQIEVFFSVPVEWYKVVNGRWIFHDWAVFTPFIYVNDDLSVPMGRVVYGFPKTLARVTQPTTQWLRNPMSPVTLARVETVVFPTLYEGKRLESHVFLEVERDAPMSNFGVPVDPGTPAAPWTIASNLAQATAGFGRDGMWFAQSMRIFPFGPASDPGLLTTMMERIAAGLAPGGTGLVLNSLNLKQFPRSEKPDRACFQGITNGRMQTTSINGAGLLGEEATLLGDLSGGYTIKLHEYSSLPIVRTLGLEVHRQWQGDGARVSALKPVMPFWLSLNVLYQRGMTLVWRTRDGIWRGDDGAPLEALQQPVPEPEPRINTSVTTPVDAITGPFRFTDTTIRVLPLLARRDKLTKFLDTSINKALISQEVDGDGSVRLSLWARTEAAFDESRKGEGGQYAYVYMTASSFGAVTSKTNNVGDWANFELSVLIPVKWQRKLKGGWKTMGIGLVPAFTFVDDTLAAVARSEVLGIPTSRATFVRPESGWLGEAQADVGGRQMLLCVKAEVIPAVGVGQQTATNAIVEISQRDSDAGIGQVDSRTTADEWVAVLLSDLEAKKTVKRKGHRICNIARALALEVLANRAPLSLYTLKQFRDCADPTKACYQSLVRVPRVFEEVLDIREIEEAIRIRFHDFPSLKLVESLGIWAKPLRDEGTGLAYGVQAIRPFYIRATIEEPSGERLMSRAGTFTWEPASGVFDSLLSDEEVAGAATGEGIQVDRQAEYVQDQGDPTEMRTNMAEAARRRRKERTERSRDLEPSLCRDVRIRMEAIKPKAARQTLDLIDPQMVIESILSREWGNLDENTRWRRGQRDLQRARETMLGGGSLSFAKLNLKEQLPPKPLAETVDIAIDLGRKDFAAVEATLYEHVRGDTTNRPGRPRMGREVEAMIKRLGEFTICRLTLEYHFDIVAAWIIGPAAASRLQWVDAGDQMELAIKEAVALVGVMEQIEKKEVIGRPSSEDPRDRLRELLTALRKVMGDATIDPSTNHASHYPAFANAIQVGRPRQVQELLGDQMINPVRGVVDQLRDAAHLAVNRCNLQGEALVNKLSRAYQKPDFCIRRDAIGRYRDRLLPRDLSWDDDWYHGQTDPEPS